MISGIWNASNDQSQVSGQFNLQLLTFRLLSHQGYGINMSMVKEVIQCPHLTVLPYAPSCVKGVVYHRGQMISVIDTSLVLGGPEMTNIEEHFMIVSEFNRSIQGFLIETLDRVVDLNWDMLQPVQTKSSANFINAVVSMGQTRIEMLDLVQMLNQIYGENQSLNSNSMAKSSSSEHT